MSTKAVIALACLLVAPPALLGLLSLCTIMLYITEPWGWFFLFGLFGLGSVALILWRLPYTRPIPFDSDQREAELEEAFYGDSEAS